MAFMEFERILYSASRRLARITLNRPEKRNAIDDVMVRELTAAVTSAAKDPAVKVVVLAGNGPAFCAGADLQYLQRLSQYDLEENRADSRSLANLFRVIYELRKPVIAAVNGPALAGGCGLASACDFVVASKEHARFGYTEVHIGFVPAIVLLFLVKKVGEGKARELVIRGNILGADEAERAGLVSRAVAAADLENEVQHLADELIANNSVTAMGLSKELLSKVQGMNLVEALDFASNLNAAARMTSDCKQGVQAFLNKHKIEW